MPTADGGRAVDLTGVAGCGMQLDARLSAALRRAAAEGLIERPERPDSRGYRAGDDGFAARTAHSRARRRRDLADHPAAADTERPARPRAADRLSVVAPAGGAGEDRPPGFTATRARGLIRFRS